MSTYILIGKSILSFLIPYHPHSVKLRESIRDGSISCSDGGRSVRSSCSSVYVQNWVHSLDSLACFWDRFSRNFRVISSANSSFSITAARRLAL